MPPPRLPIRLAPPLHQFPTPRHAHRQPFPRPSRRTNATLASAAPTRRRAIRPLIWAFVFGTIGFTAGKLVYYSLVPPSLPAPGSHADTQLLNRLSADVDALAVVRELRAKSQAGTAQSESLHADAALGGGKGMAGRVDAADRRPWVEIQDPLTLGTWTGPEHAKRLLASMTGAKGLGVNRAFWNPENKELVFVTWIGGSLSGWPGVAHGGVLATMLEECAGVAHGLAEGGEDTGEGRDLHTLGMTYLKPTLVGAFYVIKARVVDGKEAPKPDVGLGKEKDLAKRTAEKAVGTKVNCELQTLEGKVCVKASVGWIEKDVVKRVTDNVKTGWFGLRGG